MDVFLTAILGFGMGYALEGSVGAWIIFTVTALVAAGIAKFQPPGAERIYWLFVLLIIGLLVASYFGVSLHRFWFILPIVFLLNYFVARLVQKVVGRKRRRI